MRDCTELQKLVEQRPARTFLLRWDDSHYKTLESCVASMHTRKPTLTHTQSRVFPCYASADRPIYLCNATSSSTPKHLQRIFRAKEFSFTVKYVYSAHLLVNITDLSSHATEMTHNFSN